MPQPAARQSDPVSGTDTHVVLVPVGTGTVPTPTPHPFSGRITSGCSADVLINNLPAAVRGSGVTNLPPHVPIGGPSFARPPSNTGTVFLGSATVLVNGKPLARQGDQVTTCNDPTDLPTSAIVGGSPDVIVG